MPDSEHLKECPYFPQGISVAKDALLVHLPGLPVELEAAEAVLPVLPHGARTVVEVLWFVGRVGWVGWGG